MNRHEIEEAQFAVDHAENSFLRENGWKHVCDVPGSFWVWQKTLADGRTVLCNKSLALSIQFTLQELVDPKEQP